ncbi:hypothetical protein E3N88_45185 [Mikania micrantha]|uniref:TF-B3 domain-containing protein n=1 Tax=Mikania micrantha TaxID=192012 RepID=A0A5N6LAI6_9ASTR|nr:hypothetical protein E3N88_45185 [Mikania micrantha]
MANRRSPSFFKILLDTSAPHLPLPPDFASTYLGNKIIKDPTIRYVRGGYSWRLKIKKIGESFCFSDGWSNVVEDINLGFGDFLVFRLRLPAAFVELAGINGVGSLTLKNVDGKEWQTALRKEKLNHSERYFISAGWSGFRRSNDISDGDECVFKFIRSEDKLLLARVNRKKRPARQPDKHSGDPPETEVVARHSERNSGKKPAAEVERKRVQPKRNSGKSPVTETKGGRGSRGRPAKRRRGKPGR